MSKVQPNALVQFLRRLAEGQAGVDEHTDRELLRLYAADHNEAAFFSVVRRYGPMVWKLCRRTLSSEHDAEDAFQATFMVLAQKAGSVGWHESIASWLFAVAQCVARKARSQAAGHRAAPSAEPAVPDPLETMSARELLLALDEELASLPEKFRGPLIVHFLECKTQEETAKLLGVSFSTVRRRLEQGRELLHARLAGRGLVFSGALLATAVLSQNAAAASAPLALIGTTIQAASAMASGESAVAGIVSAKATALAAGVVKAMFMSKLRIATAMLLLAGALGLGAAAGVVEWTRADGKPVQEPETKPIPAADPGAKLGEDPGRPLHSLAGHKDRLTSVAYSPDGKSIATAGWDGTIRLWDPKSGNEVRRLDVPATRDYATAHLSQILFSPDGEFVVLAQQSAPNEPGVIVWNRRSGERVRDFPGLGVAIAPDGKHIACGGWGDIRLYEFATGKLVREIHSPYSRIEGLAYSPDGKKLFASVGIPRPPREDGLGRLGDDPAEMRAWNVATGKERRTGLDEKAGSQIAFSPDGRTFALGCSLWETATGGGRVELPGHPDIASAVAFSPDGQTVATGIMDGTVRLWDHASGQEIGRFGKEVERFKGGWVLSVAFSPDGRTLVSGGLDKTAHIWDVSKITGRPRTSAQRSSAELDADWKDLGGDTAKAYAALARLVSSPKQAVSFLGKHLQSAKSPDIKRIEQLVGNLDDGRFEVRQQASKDLEALGEFALPSVQKALAGNLTLEVRRRLDALLERLEGASLSAETVRQIRAVEALESMGTPEALRLLEKLATGPPEMRLTQEALDSARRLAKRSSDGP
jgi:RNA polymerase sigma factor (sigma-70 family)